MLKKDTLISCVVTAAIAATASNTNATDITTFQANESSGRNVDVYISGSTAIDNTLDSIITSTFPGICQRGTVNKYQVQLNVLAANNSQIGGGATETMWYCQAERGSGVSTNMYIAVFKESTAGSINGVQSLISVARGGSSGLTFLNPLGPDVQNGTCASPASSELTGYTHTGCAPSDFSHDIVPAGGISDVEGSLLRTIPGGGTLAASDINSYLVTAPALDVVWGFAVTKNLYYALQTAEGLTSRCPAVNGTQNLDSPICAPSLSKQQVAALLNRDIVSWKSLGLNNPSGDSSVQICRESVGSGAEAAFEAYFLGARCGTSSEAMAVQDGLSVVDSASANGVLWCMRAFDKGDVEVTPFNSDFNTTYRPFTPVGNQWAIGIISTEIEPAQLISQSDTLRLIAIDGVLPTLENVVNGYDPFWSTDFLYTLKAGEHGTPTFAVTTVLDVILGAIGEPTPIAQADANYTNVWGNGGDLASAEGWAPCNNPGAPSCVFPLTATEVEHDPVNLLTKAWSGTPRNCDTPILWRGAAGLVSPAESSLLGSGTVNQGP